MARLYLSQLSSRCRTSTYYGSTSCSTQVTFSSILHIFLLLESIIFRQQATINSQKRVSGTNPNRYRNSTLFLEQKRLAIQKNLRQLQESSISRSIIKSEFFLGSSIDLQSRTKPILHRLDRRSSNLSVQE